MKGIGVFVNGAQAEGIVWDDDLSPENETRAFHWAREKWGPIAEIRELTDGERLSLMILGDVLVASKRSEKR